MSLQNARNIVPFLFLQQIAIPRNDEWTRFVRTLAEINENRDDAEELAAQRLAAWSPWKPAADVRNRQWQL